MREHPDERRADALRDRARRAPSPPVLDPNTYGGYACARNLCRMLSDLGDARTTRQVGTQLARYFLTLKELREVEHVGVWLDVLTLVRHRALAHVDTMPWPAVVRSHTRTVMVSAWRDELEARGLVPPDRKAGR